MAKEIITVRDGKRIIALRSTEVAFLQLCCTDIRYTDIAEKMGKSRRTVDGYRDELFVKLRVRSKTGLVLWCFKSGFIKPKNINLTLTKIKQK